MEIVTTEQAAALVGVEPATVRSWVVRGHLTPLRRGARPLRFREQDVIRCHAERMPDHWHQGVGRLAEAWALASTETNRNDGACGGMSASGDG